MNRVIQYINCNTFLSVDETWSFRVVSPPGNLKQSDGWSCGVFVLLALRDFARCNLSYQQGQALLIELKREVLTSLQQLPAMFKCPAPSMFSPAPSQACNMQL